MTIEVDGHIEIPAEKARQGRVGVHVRYILISSLLLVAAGFGVVALAQLGTMIP